MGFGRIAVPPWDHVHVGVQVGLTRLQPVAEAESRIRPA